MRFDLQHRAFVDRALAASAASSMALLAGAMLFERLGYAPCELCLDQRQAHWTALVIAIAALFLSIAARARRAAAAGAGALALVYLISAGLAGYHAGVENGFWPGPASCSGGGRAGPIVAESLAGALQGPAGPSCSEAAWRFLGVSMAGYNMLASMALFALTALAALGAWRTARLERRPAAGLGA